MKPIAVFVLVAVFATLTVAASAKVTNTHQDTQNDQSVVGVAGPPSRPTQADDKTAQANPAMQPSKAELKTSKVKPKPGLNDPN